MDIKAYIESGVIESYVLGLASPEEAAELETVGMQHAEIKIAVDYFASLIQQQVAEEKVVPPANIKQQLMDKLAGEFNEAERPIIPINHLTALPATTSNGKVVKMEYFKIWRNISAAALILFIFSASLNIYYYNNYRQTTGKYQALLAERNNLQAANDGYHQTLNIIQDSVMHIVHMPGLPGKQDNMATVYWDTKTKDVYVYASNLHPSPQGMQYQLWALVNGKPVDAGVIGNCTGICKMKNTPSAQAFAITLEKAGGSKTPNLQAMYVYGKV